MIRSSRAHRLVAWAVGLAIRRWPPVLLFTRPSMIRTTPSMPRLDLAGADGRKFRTPEAWPCGRCATRRSLEHRESHSELAPQSSRISLNIKALLVIEPLASVADRNEQDEPLPAAARRPIFLHISRSLWLLISSLLPHIDEQSFLIPRIAAQMICRIACIVAALRVVLYRALNRELQIAILLIAALSSSPTLLSSYSSFLLSLTSPNSPLPCCCCPPRSVEWESNTSYRHEFADVC